MTLLRKVTARWRRGPRRRLVLHIGMGKTGTSALQVALVRNREHLAATGIDYPAHPSDEVARAHGVTNGNGSAVADLLGSELAVAAVELPHARHGLQALCQAVAGSPYRTTVYSSELLYRFDPRHLAVLVAEAERAGIDLSVVAYVRDIAPYFFSAYSERVKRNGFAGTFEEYISGADDFARRVGLFRPRISRLLEAAGPARAHVLHYDSVKRDLAGSFARDVLDVTDISRWQRPPVTVNRGLSAREFAILRYVNAGCAGAEWSGDVLVTDDATGAPTGISRRALELLEERFAPEVDWFNATLLRDRMALAGDVQILADSDRPPALAPDEYALLDRLVAAVRAGPEAERARLIAQVRTLVREPVHS